MLLSLPRILAVVAATVLVGGCITTAEQQAKRNAERCETRGYKPGTDDFADCVTRIEGERTARMEQRRREMLEQPAIPPSNRGY